MRRFLVIIVLVSLLILGLTLRNGKVASPGSPETSLLVSLGPSIQGMPLGGRDRSHDTLFERLAPEACGIDMVQPLDISHPLKRLYDSGFGAGSVALGDVDGDGRLDVFISSGPRPNRLYRQLPSDGQVRFEDISEAAGIGGGDKWAGGAVMVDIDGDGDLDIYVCYYDSPNQLFLNEGAGDFSEAAEKHGLAIRDASLFPAFADYDNDGDLDCYLLTHRYYRAGGLPEESPFVQGPNGIALLPKYDRYYRMTEAQGGKGEIRIYGRPDFLLRNDNGVFRDVSAEAGISGDGFGLSATWCDFNRDGLIDIYVANDGAEYDRLYANIGNGKFHDVSAFALPQTTWFSMGSDAGDLNNDGQFDFFAVDMSPTTHYKQKTTMGAMNSASIARVSGPPPQLMRNALFINSGAGRFREAAHMTGLASSDWSWAPKIADFDGDGWLDVFITNGVARNFTDSDLAVPEGDRKGKSYWDHFENTAPRPERNLAHRNLGELTFDDVSAEWGLDHYGMTYAAATGDLDNDGDLDLVCINLDEPVSVYMNRQTEGHRALIRLRAAGKNTWGIGAMLAVESASGWQIRQLSPMTGFLSGNDARIHFGLGVDSAIERLVIQWPGGRVQQFQDLPVDHLLVIQEGDSAPEIGENLEPPFGRPQAPVFQAATYLGSFPHKENSYDDYQRQPLLPKRLSRAGPGIAIGDVNQDGREDIFLGGAAGQPGMLLLHQGNRFQPHSSATFGPARASEDMGALFFDADGDDDLDLYVVSGGYEFEPQAAELQDRLYLNDGGNFTAAPEGTLPERLLSGSCVIACDFDRDGDLDLFIGGRLTPGQYPEGADSQLLRNDDGRFADIINEVAPGILETGMINGALWSDVDNDGWMDLIVAPEWGAITFFRNRSGTLFELTNDSATSSKGWWHGISGRDVDGDGDIDYVATNYGLNSKYHASAAHPATLHFGHFDDSGRKHLVEAEHEGDTLYPIRGKSCSSQAMPHLGELFPEYRQFALASLQEIYSGQLEQSECYTATSLSTTLFLNDGTGRFTARPLPRIAQIAPSFGVSFTEIDGDGYPDLVLAQNFSHMQPETGPMNGGLSQLLLGKGDGSFRALPPSQSGIVIHHDARSLVSCDINSDHLPDLIVGVNDGQPVALQHRGGTAKSIQLRLMGLVGNRHAIGAKVTVHTEDGHTQSAEVYAGDGYLSQSSPTLSFGLRSSQIREITVRWPDGETESFQPPSGVKMILLNRVR